jgi:NitT/TauT family transport system ATP-binding protein
MQSASESERAVATLTDVGVAYNGRQALGPIRLQLNLGETTALVGPSGCGKSTALRLLAGLETPSTGQVVRHVAKGETAVVFQAPTLAPWETVLNNVALPLRLAGVEQGAALKTARAALFRVGLDHAAALKPAQLSGGMAMRVSIARALSMSPKLVLLDEPFAALDEITRRKLADDVTSLWADARPAIAFVTHSVDEAVFMADKILVMSPAPGRIVYEASVLAGFPRPPHFRMTEIFRRTAEQVSDALAQSMGSS